MVSLESQDTYFPVTAQQLMYYRSWVRHSNCLMDFKRLSHGPFRYPGGLSAGLSQDSSSQVREGRSLPSPKKDRVLRRKMCLTGAHLSTRLAPHFFLVIFEGCHWSPDHPVHKPRWGCHRSPHTPCSITPTNPVEPTTPKAAEFSPPLTCHHLAEGPLL